MRYYKDYGLAIEGLVRHHKVDPLEYNSKVDDALPLENVIKPNPELRGLLQDLDTTKVKPWLLTNAYITHGKRVIKLLQLEDLFEGITYCDYGAAKFVCKPHKDMYLKAMEESGAGSFQDCYFVGMLSNNHWHGFIRLNFLYKTTPMAMQKQRKLSVGRQYIWWIQQIQFRPSKLHSIKSEIY